MNLCLSFQSKFIIVLVFKSMKLMAKNALVKFQMYLSLERKTRIPKFPK